MSIQFQLISIGSRDCGRNITESALCENSKTKLPSLKLHFVAKSAILFPPICLVSSLVHSCSENYNATPRSVWKHKKYKKKKNGAVHGLKKKDSSAIVSCWVRWCCMRGPRHRRLISTWILTWAELTECSQAWRSRWLSSNEEELEPGKCTQQARRLIRQSDNTQNLLNSKDWPEGGLVYAEHSSDLNLRPAQEEASDTLAGKCPCNWTDSILGVNCI